MAKRTTTPAEYLRNTLIELEPDFLRAMIELITRVLMETEVSGQIGAGRYERSGNRQDYRNGCRERPWETRVGEVQLQIPKLRRGSYYPSFLEARRRAERALMAVIQSAYVEGVGNAERPRTTSPWVRRSPFDLLMFGASSGIIGQSSR